MSQPHSSKFGGRVINWARWLFGIADVWFKCCARLYCAMWIWNGMAWTCKSIPSNNEHSVSDNWGKHTYILIDKKNANSLDNIARIAHHDALKLFFLKLVVLWCFYQVSALIQQIITKHSLHALLDSRACTGIKWSAFHREPKGQLGTK